MSREMGQDLEDALLKAVDVYLLPANAGLNSFAQGDGVGSDG